MITVMLIIGTEGERETHTHIRDSERGELVRVEDEGEEGCFLETNNQAIGVLGERGGWCF